MEFPFTLFRAYQRGVIENYNAVNVTFFVHILISGHDHLHSSHIDVRIILEPKLIRSCRGSVRLQSTVIDSIVITISLLASLGYFLSVIRSVRLAKVRTYHHIRSYMHNLYLSLFT